MLSLGPWITYSFTDVYMYMCIRVCIYVYVIFNSNTSVIKIILEY